MSAPDFTPAELATLHRIENTRPAPESYRPDEDDEPTPAPRCTCGHSRSQHTRGVGQCWTGPCGCAEYRATAVQRDGRATGRDHLRTDTLGDYLRAKGEL